MGPGLQTIYSIIFWSLIIVGIPIFVPTVSYRLLNRKGYTKEAFAASLLVFGQLLLHTISLYISGNNNPFEGKQHKLFSSCKQKYFSKYRVEPGFK